MTHSGQKSSIVLLVDVVGRVRYWVMSISWVAEKLYIIIIIIIIIQEILH